MRIVSLLPSATEIVAAIGLEDSLVGVTHECDFPPSVLNLPKVTRTHIPADASSAKIDRLVRERLQTDNALYTLDHAALERLQPDLIVTQALCDVCAVAEDEVRDAACRLPGSPRVVNLEPMTLDGMFDAMQQVARAAAEVSEKGSAPLGFEGADPFSETGRNRPASISGTRIKGSGALNNAPDPLSKTGRSNPPAPIRSSADAAIAALRARVDAVAARSASIKQRPRVAFLEWLDPPFSGGHWNPELVRLAGGTDVLGREGAPSRTLTWEEIRSAAPDILFIACCGFDAERTMKDVAAIHANTGAGAASSFAPPAPLALESSSSGNGRVFVADGSQYFNRPGPRLVDSLEILAHALHPDLHPLPGGLPAPIQRPLR